MADDRSKKTSVEAPRDAGNIAVTKTAAVTATTNDEPTTASSVSTATSAAAATPIDESKTHIKSARTKIGQDEYSVRRRAPRRPVDLRIGLLFKGEYNLSKAHEIGEGGALIECRSALKVGDRVLVTIRIPGILQGVIISTVVYALPRQKENEPIKYGIQFDQIEFDLKRKMRNYVASSEEAISTHIL